MTGGGTLLEKDGMICECDVELAYYSEYEQIFIELIKLLPCPKGSRLIYGKDGENEIPVGNLEALALYLNGTDLPKEVYEKYDINVLFKKLADVLTDEYVLYDDCRGAIETGLFFYGESFEKLKAAIQPVVDEYPLCQKCRIVQEA